jgi:SAM-dependent methyltransferase
MPRPRLPTLPIAARTRRRGRAEVALDRLPEPSRDVLRRLLAGEVSPPVALAGLLFHLGSAAEAEELLAPLAAVHPRLADLYALLRRNPAVLAEIAPLLRDHPEEEDGGEAAIAACRRFFDRIVATSEEASVALYSLGDPELLAEATGEVVDLFARWGLLGAERRTLEIGCGIGRFQVALAGRVREAVGVDVSEGMIAAARRRAQGLGNVRFAVGSGRDLAPFPDRGFDLVFAVDSFPYLQQAGPELVAAHFSEAARVLVPGGDFAILNLSYGGDLAADRASFVDLCRSFGFVAEVIGAQPFTLWDGTAFLARRERA